ncbi:Uncharacterised protein (plasmid) [Mesomycoplasma conjunctivae]|nr:Uncharacterised protein [Mesomycoplasma conjunctivae]
MGLWWWNGNTTSSKMNRGKPINRKGKTTKDIILEHNSLFNQGKKIAARPIGIYDVAVINSFAFAASKIEKNDLKFARWEFSQISRLGLGFNNLNQCIQTEMDNLCLIFVG